MTPLCLLVVGKKIMGRELGDVFLHIEPDWFRRVGAEAILIKVLAFQF